MNTRPLPNQRVVLVPSSGDISEVEVSPNILIYDNNNWHDNQTITLKGINDNNDDDNQTVTIFLDNKMTADNFVELVTTDPKYIPPNYPNSSFNGYYPYNPSVYDNGTYRFQLINIDAVSYTHLTLPTKA